ncbi:MAG: phenylacetate--CoA ligase family protein [Deltaproteobacteria bacterium]|nr:phenylacetate--CoA ligase family protein [Deltaproteobacteria bacterium]
MKRDFYLTPELNTMSQEEIRQYQEKKLTRQLEYCYRSSEFYRRKFDEAGAKPADIRTIEDLRRLPIFMVKDDERRSAEESLQKYGHPFGLHLCAPVDSLYLTGTTSGTTGTPTFSYTFTEKDIHFVGRHLGHRLSLAGVGRGDRVVFFFALGIYATTMTLWGLRGLGALPIDIDARAGTDLLLQFIELTRPTYLACTPSLAEFLVEKSPKVLKKPVEAFRLKGLLTTGEVGIAIPDIKSRLESSYGCRAWDYWSPCGNCMGISCDSDEYQGLHAVAPDVCTSYDDLVDPITKEPVDSDVDGTMGEMVITSLEREACPAVKYAYGDVVQIFTKECPACGFTGKRARLIGRADDMLIVKGVNVYPVAVKDIIAGFTPEVTGEMRIVLNEKPPRVVPPMHIKIEYARGISRADLPNLEQRIATALHDKIKIRPLIEFVIEGALPRETRKTPLFEKRYEQ